MKHILHIEDNHDFHVYINTMLGDLGNITSVVSLEKAHDAMNDIKYDLFIIDMVLEDGSGASIIGQLKKKHPGTPIIILSAHDVISSFTGLVDAVFNKAVLDFEELFNTAKKLINK